MSRKITAVIAAALLTTAGTGIALTAAAPARAATAIYVATSGSDSNAGTLAAPYATVAKAISAAAAGDTVYVRGGTYYPSSTISSSKDGTSSARITLRNYGSETVKLDGSGLASGSWLMSLSADYWTVQGLAFQNSPDSGFVCTSCSNGIFQNLTTAFNGDSGFTLRSDNTNNNLVKNVDSYRNYDAATHGGNADGIAIKFGSGTGNTVTGARLYENSDDGIDLWMWASPVTVEHTWSFGNGKNRWGDSAFAGDGNGYKLGGDGEVVAHVVNNSAAWDDAGSGFTENSNTGAIVINRTTAYANGKYGYYFATSSAKLGKNLASGNGSAAVSKGSAVTSSGNNWDSGVSTPSFISTDASTTYNSRQSGGALPATTFLTTGSTAIGATMN
jgi:hypothetical protein